MRQFCLFIIGLIFISPYTFGQKPVIDTSVFEQWPSLGPASISNDGKYVVYRINGLPGGNGNTVVRSTFSGWKKEFWNADGAEFTDNSKRLLFKEGDSVCLFSLGKGDKVFFPHAGIYKLIKSKKGDWLVYMVEGSSSGELVIADLASGKQQTLHSVINFSASPSGDALVIETAEKKDSNSIFSFQWFDLQASKQTVFWRGNTSRPNYAFSKTGDQFAFVTNEKQDDPSGNLLWRYRKGEEKAIAKVNVSTPGIDPGLAVGDNVLEFSKDGTKLFFTLVERDIPKAKEGATQVDIWSYKDELQSAQMDLDLHLQPRLYAAVVNMADSRVIRLQREGETVSRDDDRFVIVYSSNTDFGAYYRKPYVPTPAYLESTRDGSRRLLKDHLTYCPGLTYRFFSPGGKWMVYYDADSSAYYSYELATGITHNISAAISAPLIDEFYNNSAWQNKHAICGIAGWVGQDQTLLIYDSYDIWQVDPSGVKQPINITGGYGRKNNIRLRLSCVDGLITGGMMEDAISPVAKLILRAFNMETKYDGFCKMQLGKKGGLEELISLPEFMGSLTSGNEIPGYGAQIIKAKESSVWIINRQSPDKAFTYYATKDFKNFSPLSDLQPQKAYNWMTKELIHWTMSDGNRGTGILYKPEDFDPGKKYPLIFYYYEHLSNELYFYECPGPSDGAMNIAYFVSRGYLVCVPDIHYTSGEIGESVINSVVSAANYLSKMPWVDAAHMGINGHSFGGYETNYLVTHSHIFAAAAEGAGPSDFVSGYGGLFAAFSSHFWYEAGQGRFDATLWEKPQSYIKNSPVFTADRVTTPLLMMHNKGDELAPFAQAVEFFTGLRRLGKPAWLLQYDGSRHIISVAGRMDYTIRLEQFFDHYLKGAPPPVWMTEGVPARLKGIKTGLELDLSGKQP